MIAVRYGERLVLVVLGVLLGVFGRGGGASVGVFLFSWRYASLYASVQCICVGTLTVRIRVITVQVQ